MSHTRLRVPHALIALCLFLASPLAAQNGFMVMSVKGKVEWASKATAKKWIRLEVGQQLRASDVVRTGFASYAKLMVNQQRLVSIDQNATRLLSTLVPPGGRKDKAGVTGAILKYATAQMTRTKDDGKSNLYGAVRGTEPVFTAMFPKAAERTIAPEFRWVDEESGASYEVTVLDDSFNVVARRTAIATTASLAPDAAALEPGREYHWRVIRTSDGASSEVQSFRILAADSARIVDEEVARLDTELASMGADDVTTHLIRALYYEKRRLYADACREYLVTIQLAPDVEEYRGMLRGLLASQHFVPDERLLMK